MLWHNSAVRVQRAFVIQLSMRSNVNLVTRSAHAEAWVGNTFCELGNISRQALQSAFRKWNTSGIVARPLSLLLLFSSVSFFLLRSQYCLIRFRQWQAGWHFQNLWHLLVGRRQICIHHNATVPSDPWIWDYSMAGLPQQWQRWWAILLCCLSASGHPVLLKGR